MKFKRFSGEAVIIAVLVFALLALYSLGRARLGHSIPDEKRYIQSTKEMVESGDYVTPRYHGKLRFQKPILFYWLILLSYKIIGVGVFGARFPSMVAAILNVILAYLLGKELFNEKAGIYSALVLSTSEIYFMYSGFAAPDMVFILFITAAMYLFLKAYRGAIEGKFKYLYMYACMALAMLTKGPLGFIYPMMAVCMFFIFKRDWAAFKNLNLVSGLFLFTLVSAPWFITMVFLHGHKYIGNVWSLEIVKKLKYFSSGADRNLLKHYFASAGYYSGMIFARHLPWAVFLPASLISIRNFRRAGRDNGFTFIAAWFFAVLICLILIWSKESYYVLSVSIPISLLIGEYLSRIAAEGNLNRKILFKAPFVSVIILSFLALLLWLVFSVYVLDKPVLSFSLLLITVPIFMIIAYRSRNKALLPISFFIAAFASFAYFSGYIVPALDQKPLLKIADEIKRTIKPGDVVGVASGAISYHRLNTWLKDYMVVRADKERINTTPMVQGAGGGSEYLVNDFLLTEGKRVFCVITKDDYYKFTDESLRDKLFFMDRTFIWKRFQKQDREYFRRLVTFFLNGDRGLLRQALKEEVYLISNESNR